MGTYSSPILPNSSGLDLGSSSQRWDAFLKDVAVSGTLTSTDLTLTGNASVGGNLTVTGTSTLGTVIAKSVNDILYADQFAGADASAKIMLRLLLCPLAAE